MTATAPNPTIPVNQASAPYIGFDRLFISGRWVSGRSQHKVSPVDPYRHSLILEIPAANQQDIDDAYQTAKKRSLNGQKRYRISDRKVMRRAADIMDAHRDEMIA